MISILRYVGRMIPYMLVFLPIIVVLRVLVIKKLQKNCVSTTLWHELGVVVLAIFLAGLASQTILPSAQWGGVRSIEEMLRGANFTLFKVFPQTYKIAFKLGITSYFTINFLGNILMFMPIGTMLPLLWRKWNMLKVVAIGLFISLFIEFSQLFIARGTDVDDLWLNTLGALLGYLVYLLIKKIRPYWVEKCKVEVQNEK